MTTVHIENTVQDYDAWKANFDKYERFRAGAGRAVLPGEPQPH
jgi:hypothetical protein